MRLWFRQLKEWLAYQILGEHAANVPQCPKCAYWAARAKERE